ncbi:MAG: sulfite exporter TauE/SafE family protein [Rubrobacteraceae bacterium]
MGFEAAPILFGLLVGFLVGLTGVGGGSLMTPFLIAVMGVPAATAIGTDMVYATVTKLTGSFQHYRQRSINLEVAVFLGIGSIPASLLGVWTLEWIKDSFDAARVDSIMITVIAVTLVLVGGTLIFRTFMPERWTERRAHRWDGKGSMSLKRRIFTIAFGATGGYLVGLTSIGSGSIMAVILLLLYPLSPAVIVGTDIAHATVLSLVTGLAHITQGNVDFPLVGMLLLGSLPGVLVGSRVAPLLPGRPLKIILSIMLIIVGLRLLFPG